ncbi:hypothetical protein [Microbulbifer epialgicus]|uniref:Uncharacterized protein n=1 Tax=Microbulbifer epialgicus TaxID=393907 RepID=A0ABV4NTT4_9GAMM
MANPEITLSASDLSKWADKLAAEDWSFSTWKYLLGDAALIGLWGIFLVTLIALLLPHSRKRLAIGSRMNINLGTIFSAFIITWIVGIFGHGAMFGPGPYSYWLYQFLGADLFTSLSDWSFRYMTLLGLLFS